MTLLDLSGRIALVTGASGDIGAAIAGMLAAHGADVGVHYHVSRERAEAVAETVRSHGRRAAVLGADLAQPRDVETMMEALTRTLGGVGILVNNAGTRRKTGDHKYLLEVTEEEWDREIDSHLKAAFLCCKAAVPHMIAGGWGRIVNLSSVVGRAGGVGASVHYPAAKAGMHGFTKGLVTQLSKHGITANLVAPGIIDSERIRWRTTAQLQEHIDRIPAGRLGTVDEIAAAVLFLASPIAAYVTGATLDVNGGLYMA